MNNSIRVRIKGQNLRLLPQRAVYWEDEKILIVSDVHPGKPIHRKDSIPEPSNGVEKNLVRISQLMREYQVERIIFTGQFFQHSENDEWLFFREWRKEHTSVEMEMIRNNSDQNNRNHFTSVSVSLNESELTIPPFTFCHQQQDGISFDKYYICGCVNPVFSVQGLANQNVRLPCFYFGRMQAILPSFGHYSAGHEIKRKPGDQVYLVLDNSVVEVK